MNCHYFLENLLKHPLFIAAAGALTVSLLYSKQKEKDRHSEFIKDISADLKAVINILRKTSLTLHVIKNTYEYLKKEGKAEDLKNYWKEDFPVDTKKLSGLLHSELPDRYQEFRTCVEISEFYGHELKDKIDKIETKVSNFVIDSNKLMRMEKPEEISEIVKVMDGHISTIIESCQELIKTIRSSA